MAITVELVDVFCCSIDRAFKTPILGDATRFLNGYGLQPPIIGFERDRTWGRVNGLRYPVSGGNMFIRKGSFMTDEILQRIENEYWQWTIYDIRPLSLFFLERAVGEWTVKSIAENRHQVCYRYTLYPRNRILHLATFVFAQLQWRGMMKKALVGIKIQAESNETFVYESRV